VIACITTVAIGSAIWILFLRDGDPEVLRNLTGNDYQLSNQIQIVGILIAGFAIGIVGDVTKSSYRNIAITSGSLYVFLFPSMIVMVTLITIIDRAFRLSALYTKGLTNNQIFLYGQVWMTGLITMIMIGLGTAILVLLKRTEIHLGQPKTI
jgi:hypothetical protein